MRSGANEIRTWKKGPMEKRVTKHGTKLNRIKNSPKEKNSWRTFYALPKIAMLKRLLWLGFVRGRFSILHIRASELVHWGSIFPLFSFVFSRLWSTEGSLPSLVLFHLGLSISLTLFDSARFFFFILSDPFLFFTITTWSSVLAGFGCPNVAAFLFIFYFLFFVIARPWFILINICRDVHWYAARPICETLIRLHWSLARDPQLIVDGSSSGTEKKSIEGILRDKEYISSTHRFICPSSDYSSSTAAPFMTSWQSGFFFLQRTKFLSPRWCMFAVRFEHPAAFLAAAAPARNVCAALVSTRRARFPPIDHHVIKDFHKYWRQT